MSSINPQNKPIQCPDCDSYNVKPSVLMSFPEWGKKDTKQGRLPKYHCEDCGLDFETPSKEDRLDMQNGITLIIVVALMIVMLLIVLL